MIELGILAAATALGVVLVLLLRRSPPGVIERGRVIPFTNRYGTITLRTCRECGEQLPEYRMLQIGDAWFCENVEDCDQRKAAP